MLDIQKSISQYVSNQFPEFYREEGETFVEFVKTYYEWLENSYVYTVYLNRPYGTFSVGDKVCQTSNTANQGTVTEVGDGFIKVIGNSDQFLTTAVYRIDGENTSTVGTVESSSGSSVITGSNTQFTSTLSGYNCISVSDVGYVVEHVADDEVAKIKFQSGANFSQSRYSVFYLTQETSIVRIESSKNVIAAGRYLPEYRDIDTTLDAFIGHFIKKYLYGIPVETLSDKRTLVKNIVSFYRAKGSKSAYEFLFRLLYNESVDMYIPGGDVFRASDAEWIRPQYLEVSESPYLNDMVGKKIYNSSKTANALVEHYTRRIVNSKPINILEISNVEGDFNYNEQIFCDGVTVNFGLVPKTVGSLSALTIENGGYDFAVGDEVDINGSGVGGKAIVTSVISQNGRVKFILRDGGSGYSVEDTVVTVSPTFNLKFLTVAQQTLLAGVKVGEHVFQRPDALSANTFVGEVLSLDTNAMTVKRLSGTGNLSKDSALFTDTSELELNMTSFIGGGTGATFEVGAISNKEIVGYNIDSLAPFVEVVLDSAGYEMTMDYDIGFLVGEKVTSSTVIQEVEVSFANPLLQFEYSEQVDGPLNSAIVYSQDGNVLTLVGMTGDFIKGDVLTGELNGYTATITKVNEPRRITGEANVVSFDSGTMVVDQPLSFASQEGYYIPSVTINTAGTGYSNTDIVEFTGGAYSSDLPAAGNLITDDNGAIVAVNLYSNGRYNTDELPVIGIQTTYGSSGSLSCSFARNAGQFLKDTYIYGADSGAQGYILTLTRLTDWPDIVHKTLDPEERYNLDSVIGDSLIIKSKTVGTITQLKNINPGIGFSLNPVIEVIEPDIAPMYIYDRVKGGYKGSNARVEGLAGTSGGIIKTVDVVDSGFGYGPTERLSLSKNGNDSVAYSSSVLYKKGRSKGYWKDNGSFLSSNKYITDSSYYQEYSYELQSKITLDRYKDILLKLAHPTGFALFGSFMYKDQGVEMSIEPVASIIAQTQDS